MPYIIRKNSIGLYFFFKYRKPKDLKLVCSDDSEIWIRKQILVKDNKQGGKN